MTLSPSQASALQQVAGGDRYATTASKTAVRGLVSRGLLAYDRTQPTLQRPGHSERPALLITEAGRVYLGGRY